MTSFRSRLRTGLLSGVFFFGLYVLVPSLFVCLLGSLAGWMVWMEWPRVSPSAAWWQHWYPLIPLIVLIAHVIQWRDDAFWYGLYPFLAAWLVDAAGYLVGTRWGKHKCWPSVSPHKTWEGVLAGVTSLAVVHMIVALSGQSEYVWWLVLLSAPVVAVAAIMGDFFVSWHKRLHGVKDIGTALPGHGGLLDRFDSVLAVVIVVKVGELALSLL